MIVLKNDSNDNSPSRIRVDQTTTFNKQVLLKMVYSFLLSNIYLKCIQKEPNLWNNDAVFINACEEAENRRSMNNFAERSIALMQYFNPLLTKQEKQTQYLLQITKMLRRQIPRTNKFTIK